jgi:hypothetical protein
MILNKGSGAFIMTISDTASNRGVHVLAVFMAIMLVLSPVSYAWSPADTVGNIYSYIKSAVGMLVAPFAVSGSSYIDSKEVNVEFDRSGGTWSSYHADGTCGDAYIKVSSSPKQEQRIFDYSNQGLVDKVVITSFNIEDKSCKSSGSTSTPNTASYEVKCTNGISTETIGTGIVSIYKSYGVSFQEYISGVPKTYIPSSECSKVIVDISISKRLQSYGSGSDTPLKSQLLFNIYTKPSKFCADGVTPVGGCSSNSVKTCDNDGGQLYDDCVRCNSCTQTYGVGYTCQSSTNTCYKPPQCTNNQPIGCAGNIWCSSDGAVASFNCLQCPSSPPVGRVCKSDGSAWVQCNFDKQCADNDPMTINEQCINNACQSDQVRKCSDGTLLGECSTLQKGKKCTASGNSQTLTWSCDSCSNQCPSGYSCVNSGMDKGICEQTCASRGGHICDVDSVCPNNNYYADTYESNCCQSDCNTPCASQGGVICSGLESCYGGRTITSTDSEKCCVDNGDCRIKCEGVGRACPGNMQCKQSTILTSDVSDCCMKLSGIDQCTSAPVLTFDNLKEHSVLENLRYDITCSPASDCYGKPVQISLYDSNNDLIQQQSQYLDSSGKAQTDFMPVSMPGAYDVQLVFQSDYFDDLTLRRTVTVGGGLLVTTNIKDISYVNRPVVIDIDVKDTTGNFVSLSRITPIATLTGNVLTGSEFQLAEVSTGKYKITLNTQKTGDLQIKITMERRGFKTEYKTLYTKLEKPRIVLVLDAPTDVSSYNPIPIKVITSDPQAYALAVDYVNIVVTDSYGKKSTLTATKNVMKEGEWTAQLIPSDVSGVFYIVDVGVTKAGYDSVSDQVKINVNPPANNLFDPTTIVIGVVGAVVLLSLIGAGLRMVRGG